MTILSDIQAQIATIERVANPSTDPTGYGIDLSCVSDLSEDMRETDPESPEGILEWCVRVLTTDRDSIQDAPGLGWNVRRLLNQAYTQAELEAQEGLAAQALEGDDRIDRVDLSLEINTAARKVKVKFRIYPKSLALQPFDAIAVVTDGDALAELLRK